MKSYSDNLPEFDKVKQSIQEEINEGIETIKEEITLVVNHLNKEQRNTLLVTENAIIHQIDAYNKIRTLTILNASIGILNMVGILTLLFYF
jgi:hypothetical protein